MFLFRFKSTVKLGIKSLWMHRLRSMLTTLGIIFGVSSVISMLAIGEGASREAQEQIILLGSNNIILKTVEPPDEQTASAQEATMREYGLTYDDAERLRSSIPGVEVVVPNRLISQRVWYRNRRIAVGVIGTVPWYTEVSPIKLKTGRFLTSLDMHHKQAVCVIDEKIAEKLFLFDNPINNDIKIASDYYHVVGIVTMAASPPAADASEGSISQESGQGGANVGDIYIPLTTVKDRFGEISMQISGQSGRQVERIELQEIIIKVDDLNKVLLTSQLVDNLLNRFHKKIDYKLIVPLQLLEQARRNQRIFSIVLGSIAAISLLVGGIGIMNIMLATVSERTREIGIRRALGARKKDIILQFLSETLLLTLLGGLLGIVLGMLTPFLVTHFSDMPTAITISSLGLAFGICAGVGITFGLYPAYRAANMDPIESLRHE